MILLNLDCRRVDVEMWRPSFSERDFDDLRSLIGSPIPELDQEDIRIIFRAMEGVPYLILGSIQRGALLDRLLSLQYERAGG